MKKLQAVRRTLSGASVEPILAALGEFVDVEELFHIASRHDGYRDGGCIAGQAVSSAVQDLFFGGRGGVYNDVDCFAPARRQLPWPVDVNYPGRWKRGMRGSAFRF